MPHGADPYVVVHAVFGINVWWYAIAGFIVLIITGLVAAAKVK